MKLYSQEAYCYQQKRTGLWLSLTMGEDGIDPTMEEDFDPDFLYFNLDFYKEIAANYVNLDDFYLVPIEISYQYKTESPDILRKQLIEDIYG